MVMMLLLLRSGCYALGSGEEARYVEVDVLVGTVIWLREVGWMQDARRGGGRNGER